MDSIEIFNVKINNLTRDNTKKILEEFLKGDHLKTVYTPNTEIIMKAKEDKQIREIINSGDLILPDGIGLVYGSRIRKKPLKERVTGVDISTDLLEIANREGYNLYLLGGKDGIAKKAGENILKQYPNIKLVGYHHGYFKGSHTGYRDHEEELEIIRNINDLAPDIIFVGLGFPKQEIWIHKNKDRLHSKVIIGNGGTMDILSGKAERAPEIFQSLGLEWFYRLIKEPSRIKRQMIIPKFILYILFSKDPIK